MTKQEREAWSIAKQLATALRRLDNFTGDPDMVYEDLKIETRSAPAKTRRTVVDVLAALDGTSDRLLRSAPSHPHCLDVNGDGSRCDWCLEVEALIGGAR